MDQQLIFNKTRYAPTPSGFLHLGNIFSFAITAALARKTNTSILLRIDDFDMERTRKIYLADIFDTLNFLEIPWDEGPRNIAEFERECSQRHRMDIYKTALAGLKENGKLFACTCSRAQVHKDPSNYGYTGTCRNSHIPFEAKNTCWRLFTNDDISLDIKTFAGPIVTTKLNADMKDFIVRKKDGIAAYQLISVMDDLHFGVDLVVRGQDLWPSTVAQQYLSLQLKKDKFKDTVFYHHPLLFDREGHKLSKSEGATSIYHLRKEHKKPADIYSLIAKTLNIEGAVQTWQDLVAMTDFTQTVPP